MVEKPKKQRLDQLLVERGLAESRTLAQRLVMAGQVRVDGEVANRSAAATLETAVLEVEAGPRFVSRGGEKLVGAMEMFQLDVSGLVCADVGASTGGFTDCLLQNGAQRVYAIDVGHGILHWKLRQDPRVVVMEKTNARHLERLPEPVQWVTIDASFISLRILLPVVRSWFGPDGGVVVALVKPQFEAGREEAARGEGVIKDARVHRRVLEEVMADAQGLGYGVQGLGRSPLLGPKGNVEFLAWLVYPAASTGSIEKMITAVLAP